MKNSSDNRKDDGQSTRKSATRRLKAEHQTLGMRNRSMGNTKHVRVEKAFRRQTVDECTTAQTANG